MFLQVSVIHSVHRGGGVRGRGGRAWQGGGVRGRGVCVAGGACVAGGRAWRGGAWQGGVRGRGGHAWQGGAWFYSAGGGPAWFYSGGCMVLFGGHAWFYLGGGMRGFIRGACVVFSVFPDTMRYGQ